MNEGARIQRIRDALGWSQKAVAPELGIDVSTYSRLESGDVKLSYARAVQLARLFGCSTDDFDEGLGGPIAQVLVRLLNSRGG